MTDTSTKVQQATDAAKEAAAGDDVMDLTEGREDIPTPMRAVKNLGITSGMAYTAGAASIFLPRDVVLPTGWEPRYGGAARDLRGTVAAHLHGDRQGS